ncbi:hypothetical protein ACFVVM_32510 [Nocardia sp. NPDC058176]|uniref:hypothetical protein n=1 Tax=Nocardia sp. NPDC058176 TaxID=3346368 RepID=UPI0036DF3046
MHTPAPEAVVHFHTTLTPIEISKVEHALADHAATYYHDGVFGKADVANHLLVNHLSGIDRAGEVYALITHLISGETPLLERSENERHRQRAHRAAEARQVLDQAERWCQQGDYVLAAELVDEAACADSVTDVQPLRMRINAAIARVAPPAGEPAPTPGDAGLCLWKLLAKIARLHPHDPNRTALRVLHRLTARNSICLEDAERAAIRGLTDYLATSAHTLLYNGGAVGVDTTIAPAAVFLRAGATAAESWRRRGVPRGHIEEADLGAVVEAADTAMTWAILTLGYIDAHRRLTSVTPLHTT